METNETLKLKPIINSDSSLMRKTKAQLVEIILRKDSVEKELREQLNIYSERIDGKEEEISKLNVTLEEIREDAIGKENNLDYFKNRVTELSNENKSLKDKIIKIKSEYIELENDYQKECDDNALVNQQYIKITKAHNRYINYSIIAYTILFLLMLFAFCFK